MPEVKKETIRSIVDNIYDVQKLRIAAGQRIVAMYYGKIENEDKAQEDKEKNSKLKKILDEHKRVADVAAEKMITVRAAISKLPFSPSYVKTITDFQIIEQYHSLLKVEQEMVRSLTKVVEEHPMWDAFFKDVTGCGPMMAAVCIAYLDPYRARHASSFWKYCGLDVVIKEDGTTAGRNKSYTEMRPYEAKDGTVKEKKSLTYNPFVKSKLVEVLGGSFLKKPGCTYEVIYRNYKHRLENRETDKKLSPVIMHRRALRYCVKMFLRDLWVSWRTLEGLPVSDPYEVAFLGKKPHHDPNLD